MIADEYNLKNGIYEIKQGDTRHHIDFNKLNNNPTNIMRLPKEQHLILHTENLEKTIHRPDIKEKAAKSHQTREYREKMSDWAKTPEVNRIIRQNSKKLWEDGEYKKHMIIKFKEFYDSNSEYRNKNNQILNEQQRKYWLNPENKRKASEKVKKFFEETCLLDQPFVKDPDKKIDQLIKETIGILGENISVRRFSRFALGEE